MQFWLDTFCKQHLKNRGRYMSLKTGMCVRSVGCEIEGSPETRLIAWWFDCRCPRHVCYQFYSANRGHRARRAYQSICLVWDSWCNDIKQWDVRHVRGHAADAVVGRDTLIICICQSKCTYGFSLVLSQYFCWRAVLGHSSRSQIYKTLLISL